MRFIWGQHNTQADSLLEVENGCLEEIETQRRGRPPDNFMARDLAEVVQERYSKVLGPQQALGDIRGLNRGLYSALSRDSHARLRIDAAGLTIRPNGTVEVIPRRVDDGAKRRTLLNCLALSLAEAVGALSYLLAARDQADVERLRSLANRSSVADLPAAFRPDLGLQLAKSGGARTTFHFRDVPIRKLGVLPDGVACWSSNVVLGDREYVATFDVPIGQRTAFASAIGLSSAVLQPGSHIITHELQESPTVNVACRLGELQRNVAEAFVPLIVVSIKSNQDETQWPRRAPLE